MIISRAFLRRMRNISAKFYRKFTEIYRKFIENI